MSTTQGTGRDTALDFTKGVLVLLMVLYHWLNYFVSPYGFGYRYIRFLTPSFVFLTGFLITNLLVNRRSTTSTVLSKRLFSRGIRLLLLFTVLNLGVAWIGPSRPSGRLPGLAEFIEAFPASYLTGQHTSFLVLLPISYTLILAAIFVRARALFHFQLSAMPGFSFAIASSLVLSDFDSPILQLVGAGLLGLTLGSAVGQRLHALHRWWPWLVLVYVLHLSALTIWGVPYALQLISVCVNLSLFYFVGSGMRAGTTSERLISLLGQYALLGYIGQIAVLQLLSSASRAINLGLAESSVALTATLLLTVGGIVIVDLWRRRSRLVDSVYRSILA